MCKRGHSESFRNANGKCKICHAEIAKRSRCGVLLPHFTFNRALFESNVPKGKRRLTFELCGISRDCIGRLYKTSAARRSKEQREMLAHKIGVSHDELWIPKENHEKTSRRNISSASVFGEHNG